MLARKPVAPAASRTPASAGITTASSNRFMLAPVVTCGIG
jgi:hypothetical protein